MSDRRALSSLRSRPVNATSCSVVTIGTRSPSGSVPLCGERECVRRAGGHRDGLAEQPRCHGVKIAARAQAQEPRRVGAAAHGDHRAVRYGHVLLPVQAEDRAVVRAHLDVHRAVPFHHHGAVQRQVGGERLHHEAARLRLQDGAARREGVGRAPGGRGHDGAVSSVGGHDLAVDADGDLDGPHGAVPADDGLVEGDALEEAHAHFDHGALFDPAAPFEEEGQLVRRFLRFDLRDEAEAAHVDAEDGDLPACDGPRDAEDGAVSADADDEVCDAEVHVFEELVPGGVDGDVAALPHDDSPQLLRHLGRMGQAGLMDDDDPLHSYGYALLNEKESLTALH